MKHLKKFALISYLPFMLFACLNGQKPSKKADTDTTTEMLLDTKAVTNSIDTQSVKTVVTDKTNPLELITIIRNFQRKNVRDSWGTQLGECFSDEDLTTFQQGTVFRILDELKKDKVFSALLETIRQLSSSKKNNLLTTAESTYRQPWSELGLNPAAASRKELLRGQTIAGSIAERSIAEAIVGYVRGKLYQ